MNENKEQRAIYVENSLWDRSLTKAQLPTVDRSLSQIIRKLLEMWLAGEVVPYPEKFVKDGQNEQG